MSYEDPFDNIPDENVKEVPVAEEPKTTVIKSEAVGAGEGKIVSTYKEGAGYDASWTVVHAASVDDWFAIHEDPRFPALLEKQKKVASFFRGKPAVEAAKSEAPASRAPQQSQEAPGGEKRFCKHGEMLFKSGVSKAGNAYKLFSCTAPRQEQCPAEYLNKK